VWHPLDAVPAGTVAYPAEAIPIRRIRKDETFSLHGWPATS